MNKSIALTIVCLALGVLVAACGGDDDSDDNGNGGESRTVGKSGKIGKRNVKTVDMKNTQYVPMELTVPAGTTIQWTNSDSVEHTVTKANGPGSGFDSKNIKQNESYERNFPDKGRINYVCTIHPNQRGAIVVQ